MLARIFLTTLPLHHQMLLYQVGNINLFSRQYFILSHNTVAWESLKTWISWNTTKNGHISNKSAGSSEAVAALLFVDRNLVVWFHLRVKNHCDCVKLSGTWLWIIHDWVLKMPMGEFGTHQSHQKCLVFKKLDSLVPSKFNTRGIRRINYYIYEPIICSSCAKIVERCNFVQFESFCVLSCLIL